MLQLLVRVCLWYEPHTVGEMAAKTKNAGVRGIFSLRQLKASIWYVIKESISNGLARMENGFVLLTPQGRLELGKRYHLHDDSIG